MCKNQLAMGVFAALSFFAHPAWCEQRTEFQYLNQDGQPWTATPGVAGIASGIAGFTTSTDDSYFDLRSKDGAQHLEHQQTFGFIDRTNVKWRARSNCHGDSTAGFQCKFSAIGGGPHPGDEQEYPGIEILNWDHKVMIISFAYVNKSRGIPRINIIPK